MKIQCIKDYLDIFETCLRCVGIIVGAFWVYRKFISTREGHAKIEIAININVIGRIETKNIIEIMLNLQNKGLVRHRIEDLNLDISLQKNNSLDLNHDIRNKQLIFEKYDSFTNFIMKDNKNQCKSFYRFWSWGKTKNSDIPSDDIGKQQNYIDGGVKQQYTFLIDIPEPSHFISAFCRFKCDGKEFHTAQRTFALEPQTKKSMMQDS